METARSEDLHKEEEAGSVPPKDEISDDEEFIILEPNAETKHIIRYYQPRTTLMNDRVDPRYDICATCKGILKTPHIQCPECSINMCLQCFAKGKEINNHRNTHPYTIIHDDINVFSSSDWTASEEKLLLRSLELYGLGNWGDIAKGVGTKSSEECRQHYHKYYFDGVFRDMLGLTSSPYFPERAPYMYNMKSTDPPRYETDDFDNLQLMAGYRCARGDFDTPYDTSAESLISKLEDISSWSGTYRECGEQLHCAIVNAYNRRLAERQRRYKIMQDNGLLVANRTLGWMTKHSEALECQNKSGRFLAFMQITNGDKFDMLVESQNYYNELRKYMLRLHELRTNGVRTFRDGAIYFKLLKERQLEARDQRNDRSKLRDWKDLVPHQLLNGSPHSDNAQSMSKRRRAAPIDIIGFPEYTKLTKSERELCSSARIVPSAFINYKKLLIAENAKNGYLRLADARRLIKIDVNKTRQVYDFLLNKGHINKPI